MSREIRRPLHALTGAGAIAHHAFELGAGVGLVFQPWLGLGGAAVMWGAGLPGWIAVSARGSPRWDPVLSFLAGLSLGAAFDHYTLWPVRWRRGVPVLEEAEGLRREYVPAYNALLYAWAAAAASALAVETPPWKRRWALPGFLTALGLRTTARRHFEWIRVQARTDPAWWNRALAPGG